MFRKIQIVLNFFLIFALFSACFSTRKSDQEQTRQLEEVSEQLSGAIDRINQLEQEREQLQELVAKRENELSEVEQEMEEYKTLDLLSAEEMIEEVEKDKRATDERIREYQKELEYARQRGEKIQRELADLQSRSAAEINKSFNEVDEFLETLPLGSAAFEAPSRMNIGDKALAKLIISQTTELDSLMKKLASDTAGMEMTIGGKKVKLHTVMRARLIGGSGIAIRTLGEEEVAIGSQGDHEWVWEIEAKETGKQILRLQLYAIFKVQDKERANEIKTFEESIEVQVSAMYEIKQFLAKNWQWLWAAVLVPVVSSLFAWWRRRSKKNKAGQV